MNISREMKKRRDKERRLQLSDPSKQVVFNDVTGEIIDPSSGVALAGENKQALADHVSTLHLTDFKQDINTTAGLEFGYDGGRARKDNIIYTISASTILLTASSINYIQIDSTLGDIIIDTSFVLGNVPLYEIATDTTTILTVTDVRAWLAISSSSGGGTDYFVGLLDTPSNYIGHASKKIIIKSTEDGIEFIEDTSKSIVSIPVNIASIDLTDGYVLTYDAATGEFRLKPKPSGGGGTVSSFYFITGMPLTSTITLNVYSTGVAGTI